MGYQDASGRRLSYASYLHLSELLAAQDGLTKAHDELLFIVVHQVYELWFKVLIHELDAVREAIEREDLRAARHFLNRVKVIEALLVEQVGVLETMAPQDFLTSGKCARSSSQPPSASGSCFLFFHVDLPRCEPERRQPPER